MIKCGEYGIALNITVTEVKFYVTELNFGVITSPPEGVARYCFHPVCLSVCVCVCLCVCVCVCVCVRPIFWYFISRLLEEISI